MDQLNMAEAISVRDAIIRACSGELTESLLNELANAAGSSEAALTDLRGCCAAWDELTKDHGKNAELVKGYCFLLLGRFSEAEELLKPHKRTELGAFCLAQAALSQGRMMEALKLAEEALEKAPDNRSLAYMTIELQAKLGRVEEATKLLQRLRKADEKTGRYLYHDGLLLERSGDYPAAITKYRQAVQADGTQADAYFRLGYLLDLYGTEADEVNDEAVQAYEACVKLTPIRTNAVMNLGLLYEDRERFHDAVKCYEAVLRRHPNHQRARLYLEDAQAATLMFYDKEQEKKADRQSQVLKIPVSDFELSVRSRNCLQKMNIQCLGDLIMKTEQELLSYKNFGETSLAEIKEMLAQKGLRLGQGLENRSGEGVAGRNPLEATASAETLDKPIEDLTLSVRSRRCMERLEVRSIRDLINKTEVELMSAKNFGMTSLNEIKRKLGELGLSLRS